MRTHVIMRPIDNVATAITTLNVSDKVAIDGFDDVTILTVDGIEFGHKFAIVEITEGTDIIKYGEIIGVASCDIQAGEHVHVHNVDGKRGRGDVNDGLQTKRIQKTDGTVGIRNHVLILPTIVCATQAAMNVTKLVDGTVSVVHQHGCAQVGVDYEQTFRTYVGMGLNPNVYGVVVMGLGCETHQGRSVAEEIAKRTDKPVELVSIQDHSGTLQATAEAAKIATRMVQDASMIEREPIRFSDLIVGTECGGSDACSGLSANPAVGYVSDRIAQSGGTSILAETTELIGAEHLLAERAKDDHVAKRVYEVIEAMENRAFSMGVDIRTGNPSPGNRKGGLTTLEEKSLGAAAKAGSSRLNELVSYAERPSEKGLVWMDTPGHDIEQLTGMTAGGAQLVLFTSGRGTPTGSPIAPVIKISTNSSMFETMNDNMDVNTGTIIEGKETIEEAGERLMQEIATVASGKRTKAEIFKQHDFGIWRIGPTF